MSKNIIPYNPKLKEFAHRLRKESTLAEVLLWRRLQGRQMLGFDFHRQKPIDNYIVDFYCPALKLAIEIDGVSHEFKYDEDEARQKKLESWGVHVLRFADADVKKDIDGVIQAIDGWMREHTLVFGHSSQEVTHPRPSGDPSQEGIPNSESL